MKKIIILLLGILFVFAFYSLHDSVIAYGSEFDIKEFLKLKEDETADVALSVDTKVVGTYQLEGNVIKNNQAIREIETTLEVKDQESPQIKTMQPTNKIYEIPLHDTYQPLGNIEMITDAVDGEYKEIIIVNETEYNDIKKHVSELKEQANKNVFHTNDEVETYKNSKEKSGYSILHSTVDVSHAGTYDIHILSVDCSFNTKEISYKVKVLEEGQQVGEGMLAIGTSTSDMSDFNKYIVTDKRHIEEPDTMEQAPGQEQVAQNDTNTNDITAFENNIVSSDSVSSQESPVLQSALSMVGSHMMCDDLVTTALVNAGMITGEAPAIFMNGSLYNIGVYQFPSVGQFISAGEAIPGDLVYYDNGGYGSSHIAVYAGNGQAVHGGWNGMNVVVSTVNIGSGPRYMRFSPMTWSDLSIAVFGYDVNEKPSNTIPPSDEWIPPEDVPQDSQEMPEIDWGEPGTTYSTQSTVNDVTIAVSSTSPIDQEFVAAQTEAYANGGLTYEEVVSNLQAKGYTIIDPF